MAIPNTPKSSGTKTKIPKTPKSSAGRASGVVKNRPHKTEKLAKKRPLDSQTGTDKVKKQKKTASKPPPMPSKENKDKKEEKQKKAVRTPKKAEPKPVHTSVVDDVTEFFGQKTKVKNLQELQKQLAIDNSENGVFHYDTGREQDIPALTEMQLAYIAEANPMKKMKISSGATKYGLLEIEQLYGAKCQGLNTLRKISKRETLGMDTIHAERTYLSDLDLSTTDFNKRSASENRKYLVEDYMKVFSKKTDDGDIRMKPIAWKECSKIDQCWDKNPDSIPLAEVGKQLYGSKSVWSAAV